jgi:GntR family transcriptional regulator, trigonelline degradation regulator
VNTQSPFRVGRIAAPVRSQTVGNLRSAILAGRFAAGARLVEAELCRLLGVSRPSVREALRQLEAERLVVITPFKGPAVAKIDWPEAEQIYEVRALLEGQAAYLFATRASKEQVAVMRSALKHFEDAVRKNDAEGRLLHTDEFYNVMLKGSGNVVIGDLLTGLHARINLLRARSMSQQGRSSESTRELRRIVSAIAAGDAETARAACIEHVRRAADAAKASFAAVPRAAKRRPGGDERS